MSYLYDYGEGLFCFLPVFLVMTAVFAALVWNNLPSRTIKETKDESHDGY